MKQISARKFRVAFPVLTEPVLVTQRRDDELVNLGVWTPSITYRDTWTPVESEQVPGFNPRPFTPVPRRKGEPR